MPDFTAVDPDVLDESLAYGSDDPTEAPSVESSDERSERLARAFDQGATLRLDTPAPEPVTPELGPDGQPIRRRRKRGPNKATAARAAGSAQMGSLFVAGFTILIGFTVGDWAAPTEAEGEAIAVPLGNILARRIDLASKLGRDTDDVVNLAIALMAYMARIGPIAAGRAQNAWRERQRTTARADGPPVPLGNAARDNGGTARVPPGRNDQPGSPVSAADSPINAYASIAERQLRGLGIGSEAGS